MVDGVLFNRLTDDTAVAAIVGARVYQMILPQSVQFPAISFQRVSTGGRDLSHSGTTETAIPTFQVSAWTSSKKQARQLAEAIVACLHGWKDLSADPKIFRSAVINETDLVDTENDVFHVAIDVEIWHREG